MANAFLPWCDGPIRHNKASEVTKGFAAIKIHVEVVEWALACDNADGAAMAKRTMLQSTTMQWVIRQLNSAGCTAVPPLLKQYHQDNWEGGKQTVINERLAASAAAVNKSVCMYVCNVI